MKIKPIEHAEFHLVQLKDTPHCIRHGAMNKITADGIWRCISVAGYKYVNENGAKGKVHKETICRAGCQEVKEMRHINFADELEQMVGEALYDAGIEFKHESEGASLDFYIPQFDCLIEVKRFHTDRISKQLRPYTEVILLMGKRSVEEFCNLIKQSNATNNNNTN